MVKFNQLLACLICGLSVMHIKAQKTDTLYIKSYPEKLRISGNVSTSFIQLNDNDRSYTPNYPLGLGVGFAVKNTLIGIETGYGIIALKPKNDYGRSRMVDFQIHNYGRRVIIDLYFQHYKGFYSEKKIGEIDGIYPDMSVMQIGGEATYLFSGDRFSSKAAFDLNEIQLRSAGSWLLGGGTYYYNINRLQDDHERFENIQLGANAGYAYSWVINDRWTLSTMAKAGANFGNTPQGIKKGRVEIYPTAFARFVGNYHKDDWGISMSVMISNKSIYPITKNELTLTSVLMQLTFVKHLDHLFRSKN